MQSSSWLIDFHVRLDQGDLQKGMETFQAIHTRKIRTGILLYRPSRQIRRKCVEESDAGPIPETRKLFRRHGIALAQCKLMEGPKEYDAEEGLGAK
jgi:hypothetical protein